jgi:hypothetical protein
MFQSNTDKNESSVCTISLLKEFRTTVFPDLLRIGVLFY